MNPILSLSMRPRRLSSVIGQRHIVEALRKQMTTRPAHAIMFSGQTGGGKTSLARIVAFSLQCGHQQTWGEPCDQCLAYEEFTIHEVNASETSGIDELRQVADLSKYQPNPPSKQRVIILDEAQRISSAAQNLLLKPFEEPPATTTWIVCTTDPTKILPTLRRRMVQYHVRSLSIKGIELLLQRAAKRIQFKQNLSDLVEALLEQQTTSPALVIMAFEKFVAGMTAKEAATEFGREDVANSLAICKTVSQGNWNGLRKFLGEIQPDEARWIRSSVVGWYKGWMLKENNPATLLKLANSIKELSTNVPTEENLLYPWLIAVLYRICHIMKGN